MRMEISILERTPSLSPFKCNASLNVRCAVAVVRPAVFFAFFPPKERRLALPAHLCAPGYAGGYTPLGLFFLFILSPASPTRFRILRAVDAAAG